MKENWFLLGDIHGEKAPIANFYNQNKDRLNMDKCQNNIILCKFMDIDKTDDLDDILA